MPSTATYYATEISCGTLVINDRRQILLGRVSDKGHWEIPKGRKESQELPLQAARRELKEETGLNFNEAFFEEIGPLDYREGKRLHLYKVYVANTLDDLTHLQCTSFFPCDEEDEPVLAMDAFRWASREEIEELCLPRLAKRLLTLTW